MRKATIVLALGLLLVGAACSSKDTSEGGGGTTTTTGTGTSSAPATSEATTTTGGGGGGTTLAAVGTSFDPTEVSVASGDTLTFQNNAGFAHTFTIDGEGIDSTVNGGASTDIAIDLDPGTYDFYCRFHGSPGSGMHGTLTVT